MDNFHALLAFVAAAGVLTITPGLDTALVLRTCLVGGPRQAALAGLGIVLGCLLWGAAVAVGLGVLVAASEWAFTLLKWTGATYLMWLGLQLIRRPRRWVDLGQHGESGRFATGHWFRRGVLTNLLNPKVGVFYVSFMPQFVPAGTEPASWTMLLAVIHAALGCVWFAFLIFLSRPLSGALRHPGVVMFLDRLTGTIFLGFGFKLAASSR